MISKKPMHYSFYSNRLKTLDAFVDKKLNNIPMELDHILFNDNLDKKTDDDDKDDNNKNDNNNDDDDYEDGMKMPIPQIAFPPRPERD